MRGYINITPVSSAGWLARKCRKRLRTIYDFKTMQERGVFATMAVVAVTAQNTLGVQDALPMPPKLIDEQCASLAADLKIRACKTGMLADPTRVMAVVRNLQKYDFGPVTVDPVMIAKGGAKLLSDDAIATVRDQLLPLASLVTPNLPEAEELTGMKIQTEADMITAGKLLQCGGIIFSCGQVLGDIVAHLADGAAFDRLVKLIQKQNLQHPEQQEQNGGKPQHGQEYLPFDLCGGLILQTGSPPLSMWRCARCKGPGPAAAA